MAVERQEQFNNVSSRDRVEFDSHRRELLIRMQNGQSPLDIARRALEFGLTSYEAGAPVYRRPSLGSLFSRLSTYKPVMLETGLPSIDKTGNNRFGLAIGKNPLTREIITMAYFVDVDDEILQLAVGRSNSVDNPQIGDYKIHTFSIKGLKGGRDRDDMRELRIGYRGNPADLDQVMNETIFPKFCLPERGRYYPTIERPTHLDIKQALWDLYIGEFSSRHKNPFPPTLYGDVTNSSVLAMFVIPDLKAEYYLPHLYEEEAMEEEYQTYYEILGVSSYASTNEINQAFRNLAKSYHPDVNHARGAERRFILINNAHDVLSDEIERKKYDDQLRKWNEQRVTY